MAFFEWQDTFSVGIAGVDEQHRRLIGLVNRLHEVIERSDQTATLAAVLSEIDTVRAVIDELTAYAACHFATEDAYMTAHPQPEDDRHRAEHLAFVEQIGRFREACGQPKSRQSLEIATFCKTWWENHILQTDKALGAFLVTRGVS